MTRLFHAGIDHSLQDQSGAVLIIVLWISIGLVSVALLFGHAMMLEYRMADNVMANEQADQAIEGAVRYVTYVLDDNEDPGTMPDSDTYESEAVQVGESYFWLLGRDANQSSTSNSQPSFGLIDENSKLNLNTATLEMLENLPNMTDEFAAAIIDWRDSDSDVTENGAESETYLLQRLNYDCKNASFETPFELRLVYQSNFQLLFGEDTNLNGILDPNENDGDQSFPSDDQDGVLDAGILDYVTVFSQDSATASDGSEKIDVNSEDTSQLSELLSNTFSDDRATEILQNVSGGTQYTSLLDFYKQSEMTQSEFAQIEGNLTVSSSSSSDDSTDTTSTTTSTATCLVNVNTAPAAVLACIPGIDSQEAESLVSYRSSHTSDTPTIAWVTEVLDDDSITEAGPYLTSRSYQFTADIVAVGHLGNGYRRTMFVLDTSGGEAKIIYRRDLTGLGWALGTQIRQQLLESKESNR